MLKLNLHKTYQDKKRKTVVQCKAAFELGTTHAIYGRSGIGKSAILRMIAGLEQPDKGKIEYENQVWFDSATRQETSIADRNVGFVFQTYNLFPNMTVEGNLKYASGKTFSSKIEQLLEVTELNDLLSSYPADLSGGERQRVAIVRALCQNPQLLLLDEPFSALDDETIGELMVQIKQIQVETGTTVLMVSHRKDVLIEMATSVVILKKDEPLVQGKPAVLLERKF